MGPMKNGRRPPDMTRATRCGLIVAAAVLMFYESACADDGAQKKLDPPPAAEQSNNPAAETAGRVIQQMRAAEARITKRDTGTDTRDLQQAKALLQRLAH